MSAVESRNSSSKAIKTRLWSSLTFFMCLVAALISLCHTHSRRLLVEAWRAEGRVLLVKRFQQVCRYTVVCRQDVRQHKGPRRWGGVGWYSAVQSLVAVAWRSPSVDQPLATDAQVRGFASIILPGRSPGLSFLPRPLLTGVDPLRFCALTLGADDRRQLLLSP